MRILVVEDEVKAAEYLRKGLTESGYLVEVANTGLDARHLIEEENFDLVVMDIMLPQLNGWQLLELLRKRSNTPVLFLTARDSVEDRVRGLESGGDDYLVKPFSYAEFLARVRSLLRRGGPTRELDHLVVADLELDLTSRTVTRGGKTIALTPREFSLLHLLLTHQEQVLARTDIATQLWDMNFDSDTKVVDVAVRRLRAKVDDGFALRLIHNVRGVGYVLRAGAHS
ncbi:MULTISPECIES: heavy metal response regulator transcription factor [unclassified Marinobacter]|uniref:heavy metal response regulator transcription factor n=1 Tax=unclassified Marinobacter TaxID=83889 RepID=UPI00126923CE|nr:MULTISPECIES: heavy metal response regulator transcription factor [unclassified Marinobacter]QFS88342.1 Transcriptional activator protein CzcR [Marinobacter sp. THAF197a]QFT52127.1 Transcriptional activator protein CzcR [Marinobacter sp. THAF39]